MNKVLFGNPEVTAFYQTCKTFIFTYNLCEIYRVENNDDEAVLILFNLYRYTKQHKTGKIYAEYLCLKEKKWKRERVKKTFTHCYNLPIFKVSLKYLLYMQHDVIVKVVNHLQRLHPQARGMLYSWKDKIISMLKKYLRKRSIILSHYENHMKHLTKWLWLHFWDKSVISMLVRIEGYCNNNNLSHYIFYQKYLPVLDRVKTEFPNLLPLLSNIRPCYWDDPNLFSYQYWVISKEGQLPRCQETDFLYSKRIILPFCRTKQQWRWLKKQSSQFVKVWMFHQTELEYLIQHGISEPMPVCLKICILTKANILDQIDISKERFYQALRLFIRYAIFYWKNNGFKALRVYLKNISDTFYDIGDYLAGGVGQHRGLPPTWEQLINRSLQWHRQLLEEQQRRQDEAHQQQLAKSWNGYLSFYKIESVEFTALTTGQALYEEGQRMQHCIFTYTDACADGVYLAFSVKYLEPLNTKMKPYYSTLGLFWHKQKKKWQIEQHRGACNQSVSEYLEHISKQFCEVLNDIEK